MTTLLSPAVTLLALVAAAACAAVAWHTVRTARRQAEDRVAALAAAIHDTDVLAREPLRPTPGLIAFGTAAVVAVLAGAVIWNAGTADAPAKDQRPLELARLQHGVAAGALTVSGEVTVPGGRPARGLAIELITLDRQGQTIASNDEPLAPDAALPRGHMAFSVSVPYSNDVSRYTIRFRDVSGLRPHVDRRHIQVTRR